jgi:5'-methylthioadenosine phosphorylase
VKDQSTTSQGGATTIGVLGGSGLYEFAGMAEVRETPVSTPFGPPSAPPMVGRFAGRRVIFIPRHGRGHRLLPSEINYRANICALKQLGATQVVSISAVGSMREEIRPGDFVLPDQFIDRTHARASTFFGDGCVGHVNFADPVCPELTAALAAGAEQAMVASGSEQTGPARTSAAGAGGSGAPHRSRGLHRGGTYVTIEGPQFSTRAESNVYRGYGVHVIGMTAVTEAKLCREAELCFAVLALATDYDCWHPEEATVTATAVVEVLRANIAGAQEVLRHTLPALPTPRLCGCAHAVRHAILTNRDAISLAARERLRGLYGRDID